MKRCILIIAVTGISIVFGMVIGPRIWVSSIFSTEIHTKEAPYPPSPVIESITWDFNSLARAAPGSDLWPITWADNDHLYTAWGDGGGFGGTNSDGRVSIGVARVEGIGENWHGFNVWGGKDPESSQSSTVGKCNGGIISIEGVLYLYVTKQGTWDRCRLWKSTNHGMTWTDLGWLFDDPVAPGIIQFGKHYAGARDNYVYGYN